MRLRIAVAMPEKGGRPAIVVAEVQRALGKDGRRQWNFTIGLVERVKRQNIEGARDRVLELAEASISMKPCVFVDAGTPQGVALWRSVRKDWTRRLHRPHAYERTRFETAMFAVFLEAYADGRVKFLGDLDNRKELDRALVLYKGGGVSKVSDDLESEDEALVVATCLALMWPSHGGDASRVESRDGSSNGVR